MSLEDKLAEQKRISQDLEGLLKYQGWGRLVKVVEVWISKKQNELLTKPITSQEDALERNLLIGEIRGLQSVLNLPHVMKGAADDLKKVMEKGLEEEVEGNAD